jgi:site-specific DNA recombinase
MNNNHPYGYTPNELGTGYEINPGEAAEVRLLFEQAATKGVAIYMRTNDPGKEATPKRAAIYARSATQSQEVTGMSSIDRQLAACQKYCTYHGYTLEEKHIYHEIVAGKEYKNRPQFTALLAAAKERQFDVLVIFSIDRLARDFLYRTMILDELTRAGITVECSDGQNLDDPAWKLAEAVLAEVAQVERQKIISRMQHGKAAKRAQREQQQ